MPPPAVYLAVEDLLSEYCLRAIISHTGISVLISAVLGLRGSGYLKSRVDKFNQSAQGIPFFLLTDLNSCVCPPDLINSWLNAPRHNNLILRVAVREIEAWLLADRVNLSKFLGVSTTRIPRKPDEIHDPKGILIMAASRSRKRVIRHDLVPIDSSTARVGRNYNGRLREFVYKFWDISAAKNYSPSLKRAVERIESFSPQFD